MSALLKPLPVREALLQRGVGIFTLQDFQRIFDMGQSRAKYFLEEQTRAGLFLRLKKGLYALKTDLPPRRRSPTASTAPHTSHSNMP